MSEALFLSDSYLKESSATVVSVKDDKYVTLDQTIFYAKGGGQPYDTGKITRETEVFNVIYVGKFLGEKDVRIAAAIEAFSKGLISVGRAAEIAEIPIQEFLVELKKRGVKAYPYTDKEALKELML